MRNEFDGKTKALAFARSGGKCEICTIKLRTGNIQYDHEIPCGLDGSGGEATLDNCRVVCRSCHGSKTAQDVKRIAKAKRNYRKAHGIYKASRFACSRASKWKKKINGEVVERD